MESWNWMCGGRVDVWWFRFGCVVVFFVGWIWIYGTWVFGVDLWWLLEKIFDVHIETTPQIQIQRNSKVPQIHVIWTDFVGTTYPNLAIFLGTTDRPLITTTYRVHLTNTTTHRIQIPPQIQIPPHIEMLAVLRTTTNPNNRGASLPYIQTKTATYPHNHHISKLGS